MSRRDLVLARPVERGRFSNLAGGLILGRLSNISHFTREGGS